MSRVLRAYLWAIWTRDRMWILLGSIATVAMIGAAPLTARMRLYGQEVPRFYLAPYVSFIQFLILKIFLFDWDFKGRRVSFHSGSFTRPARTFDLVAAPILTGTAVVVLFWFFACRLIFQRAGVSIPFLTPAIATAVTLAAMQTGAMNVADRRDRRATFHLILFQISFLPHLFLPLIIVTDIFNYTISYNMLFVSFSAYALILQSANLAARSDRRGDYAEPIRLFRFEERLQRILSGTRDEPIGLTTPSKAQFWIEYTLLRGRPVFLIQIILAISFSLYAFKYEPSGSMYGKLNLFFLAIIALQFTSLSLGAFPLTSNSGGGSDDFSRLRPFSSADFVAVKYRVAARNGYKNIIFYVLIFSIAWLIYRYYWNYHFDYLFLIYRESVRSKILSFSGTFVICLAAVFWRSVTELLVAGTLYRRNPWIYFPAVLISFGFPSLFLLGIYVYFDETGSRRRLLDFFHIFFIVSFLAKAPLAFLAYRSALELRLIGARTLILGFASWTGVAACGFMLYRIVFEGRSPPIHPIVALMGIASLVPLCRYALAPLAMYWVRHR